MAWRSARMIAIMMYTAASTVQFITTVHGGINGVLIPIDRHGAWWYYTCADSNLNGKYFDRARLNDHTGIFWNDWKNNYYSMKRASMKIRPNN